MKLETTFLGKYFYFGSVKGVRGYNVDKKMLALKEDAKQVALMWYEEQVRKLMVDEEESIKPTTSAEKKRRRAEKPVVTQDAAPVKAPAPVEQPRRRRAPAPTPTPTLEPRPSSTAMLLGAHDTYLEQRHKSLPTYEYTHGDTQAWYKGESVELDDYESTVDIELDPEHIYWMDMSTKRFVFKTYID